MLPNAAVVVDRSTVQPAQSYATPVAPHDPPRPRASRFSLSGWALLRGAGDITPSLGQLGGSQAGMRGNYALDDAHRFSLTARLSAALRSPLGKEAALGVAIRPITALPVQIIAERRIALDSGGRNDFELMVVGGVYDRALGHNLHLSGYAEAGVVGVRKRDMFIDGAVEIMHPIASRNTLRVEAGVAGWGAAQTGVARLDIGPEAALHARIGGVNMKLAASYRFEIAGNAAPRSGPALSLGTDF